jgi:pantetheine-phosphate adenylyltransferase
VSEARAIIPGTFDPVTSGHLDIIDRSLSLYDDIIVAVALSPEKGGGTTFSLEERVELLERATAHLEGVRILPFDTLLVDFAREVGARVIIKGLRAVSDFEREFQMAQLNHGLEHDIETMFIMAIPDYAYLSSSAVKEIARHGGPVDGLVPEAVATAVVERLNPGR